MNFWLSRTFKIFLATAGCGNIEGVCTGTSILNFVNNASGLLFDTTNESSVVLFLVKTFLFGIRTKSSSLMEIGDLTTGLPDLTTFHGKHFFGATGIKGSSSVQWACSTSSGPAFVAAFFDFTLPFFTLTTSTDFKMSSSNIT